MTVLVNLHSHLEGRVNPATAAALAKEASIPTPGDGWDDAIVLKKPGSLTTYLHKVAATYPFFRSPEAVRRIAREAVLEAAADGEHHLELRFGPATHATDERGMGTLVDAALEGLRDGRASTGVSTGLVLAALRHHDTDVNEAVARVAVARAGEGIVGFDLAGDELLYPALEPHVKAFSIARAAGLGITCHAAEAAPAHWAQTAVSLLGATRIGHGAHIADDPDVMAWCADQGIVVEICPTSNVYTGAIPALQQHPEQAFRRAGIAMVLGDDNPVQTGRMLADEHALLTDVFGWSATEVVNLARASINAAFLEPADRIRLTQLADDALSHI